jgi:hypothetical protein
MEVARWKKGKLIKFGIITVVLVLLVLELVFRLIFAIEYKGYNTSVYIQGNTIQKSDSLLTWRNRPCYLDLFRRFQYNEEGMKSRPGDVKMPAKKETDYWIFLFGGSTMEGMGSNANGEWLDISGTVDHTYEETIGGILEKILQDSLPGKKVRVFNAANTGYTIQQSILQYQRLSAKYAMDWVVSMDGQNEPARLPPGLSVRRYLQEDWNNSHIFKFPLNMLIPVTSHSALVAQMKLLLYKAKLKGRLQHNKDKQYPRRKFWMQSHASTMQYAPYSEDIQRAVDSFYTSLLNFDSLLSGKNQRHLLLVQPHLSLRNARDLNETEKALHNYYVSASGKASQNTYLRELYNSFDAHLKAGMPVRHLGEMHTLKGQVFTDYCHFTREANEYAARLIAGYILQHR